MMNRKNSIKSAPKSDRNVNYALYATAGHNESQIGQKYRYYR